jgi:hypothetical protein
MGSGHSPYGPHPPIMDDQGIAIIHADLDAPINTIYRERVLFKSSKTKLFG